MDKRKKPELLVPAGAPETLKAALNYGADAVYMGGDAFGLRAKARNFSKEQMAEGIHLAHEKGVKVFVTANIFAHNRDIEAVEDYFRELKELGPDALIISDPGIFLAAKKICPKIPIHISTQSNNTNYETCRFWYELGAARIVSARELSIEELKEIRQKMPSEMELETFVHGSMCISYSGRCLLSSFFTGRDANRGECTHPCRWNYSLMEESRPGEYYPVFENERGTYIFNSKDLCMIEHIPELFEAGIDSFKIEGRMKNALYVATTARTYRQAVDDYYEDPDLYRKNIPWYKEQIADCTYREFTTGFFFGRPSEKEQIYKESTYRRNAVYLGMVDHIDENGRAVIEQKNKFSVGDTIEIMKPSGENIGTEVIGIYDENGLARSSAPHAKQKLCLHLSEKPDAMDILRVIV